MTYHKKSKRYRPIHKWTKHKHGDRRIYYIKNEIPYRFIVKDGGKLEVQARSKEEAIRKAKGWERWLRRTKRGTDIVDFSKGIWKWNEKTNGYKKLK